MPVPRARQSRDHMDSALGHTPGPGSGAIERASTEPVGERIDETCDVRLTLAVAREICLPSAEWLDERDDKGHRLDAETWGDRVEPGGEQLCEMGWIARRTRGADPDHRGVAVDAVEREIETPRAGARLDELGDRVVDQVACDPRHRLGGAARLEQATPAARRACREQRFDRLGHMAERLGEAAVHRVAEALGNRRAWGFDELLDALEPELAQRLDRQKVEPARRDRKQCHGAAMMAGLYRDGPARGHV